jgi:hypothetical protein
VIEWVALRVTPEAQADHPVLFSPWPRSTCSASSTRGAASARSASSLSSASRSTRAARSPSSSCSTSPSAPARRRSLSGPGALLRALRQGEQRPGAEARALVRARAGAEAPGRLRRRPRGLPHRLPGDRCRAHGARSPSPN